MSTDKKPKAPERGWHIPNTDITNAYRATAYCEFEKDGVENLVNANGFGYSKEELEAEIINLSTDWKTLTPTTRELIFSKIEDTQGAISTLERVQEKGDKDFYQFHSLEIDILRGIINRYKEVLFKNTFEEIN